MIAVLINEKEKSSQNTLSNTGRLALGTKIFALVVVKTKSVVKSPGCQFWYVLKILPEDNNLNR